MKTVLKFVIKTLLTNGKKNSYYKSKEKLFLQVEIKTLFASWEKNCFKNGKKTEKLKWKIVLTN